MKKNELIHVHSLLANVARDFLERGLVAKEDLEPYERLEVTPMTLRGSRDAHEEAVQTLSRILADAAQASPVEEESRKQTLASK